MAQRASKCRKAMMCLVRIIPVSQAGMSYSAVDCEFTVNESTIYIKQGSCKQRCA
jgi:hypothetical protein